SQEPCSLDGRKTGMSKIPKDPVAHRQGLPWGGYESPGRNNSERECGLEKYRCEGRARSQVPLPETANELCAVARDLGVDRGEISLGERPTEAEIKRLSATGKLSNYRLIHFATHGALAGQFGNGSEPGLLLTPPTTPTEMDDGYLS